MPCAGGQPTWYLKYIFLCITIIFGFTNAAPVDNNDNSRHHHRHKPTALSSVVDLGYTKYNGTVLEAGVNQYLGIRYAAPPTGHRRWRAPQDPLYEHGVQEATQFGATCLGLFGPTLSNTTNEDCLFLDVFAPSNATTESKLPVWFFIQGGGYAGNTDQNFNATEVVMRSGYNMVFVQINYRVGAFGFLASEKIRRDGDLNVGLLDQRKALHWAQKYIHLFGGDPEHVVIHGDSAGAGSIAYQLTAYGGRDDGLFVGGISESPFLPTHRTVSQSEFQFDKFVANVSCSHARDTMACLRSKDTATLQASDVVSPFPGTSGDPDWYFLPVVDGTFSPDYLYTLLERGRVVKVPVMVGDDNDEGTGFSPNASTPEQFLAFIKDNYPLLTEQQLREINKTYPLASPPPFPDHAAWFPSAEKAYGEATFICPGIEFTRSLAQYLSPDKAWNYRYNVYDAAYESIGLGVPHVSEKPAIFGPNNAGPCGDDCSYLSYNRPIVPVVMNYWISFIRTLDPNTHKYHAAPVWRPWGRAGGERLRIQLDDTAMERVPPDQLRRCDLWKRLAKVTQQ